MTDRILDLSEAAVQLTVRYEQLIVERPQAERVSIPLSDIAVIVASHPHIRYSQSVLAGLAANGGVLVACDERCFPTAMMLPLEGHSTQAERFAKQTQLSLPAKKRMWKQIVQAKIAAQADVLHALHGDDAGLRATAARVGSGDPQNLEATASQRYWPRLFGDPKFRRRRDGEDQNRDLNYGYAVLRAITARAIAAAGLHASFGLHHSNRYNAFALADDLMEPYRPLVDQSVAATIREWGFRAEFDKAAKRDVLDGLLRRFDCEGESRTLFDWMAKTASSLAAVCLGESKELYLPRLRQPIATPSKAPERETGTGLERAEGIG